MKESMKDGFKPTLAIIFLSIKLDRKAICQVLQDQEIDILGATSCGEFINGHQDEGSAVILLLDIHPDAYAILYEDIGDNELSDVAAKLAKDGLQKFAKPGFIVCSTFFTIGGDYLHGDVLIRSMGKELGSHAKVYGGMAGDDGTFTGTYVFTYEQSSDSAIAALVLDEERISLHGMAISGWNPLGITRTVTKCEDGWIYTIDDKPALDMYLKYLGMGLEKEGDDYELAKSIGFYYPFQVEDAADPVMRTPMMIDKEKNALKLDFEVPEGTKFRFSMPPDFDIADKVVQSARELKSALQTDAEALLIFSCAGRLNALGPFTKIENDGLSETWNAPMAGFFSYGEFGTNEKGRQEFHSTTCCWVALKENEYE